MNVVLKDDTKYYIDYLTRTFGEKKSTAENKISRTFLRLHVRFLSSQFRTHLSDVQRDQVFWKILFPFLLLSKNRECTANVVWERLNHKAGQKNGFDLLEGCADVWEWEANNKSKTVTREERMKDLNLAVAGRIAGEFNYRNDV